MSSEYIYSILSSKPHNSHYLKRYFKFIMSRVDLDGGYKEDHHICPKSKDLFPEYISFKLNPWNKIRLGAREHFIAHWMLHKAYGRGMSYAFKCMCDGQKSKYQSERYSKINSTTYKHLKESVDINHSKSNKGKASYYDKDGNVIRCSTNDERVLSGELISTTKGRNGGKRSDEWKQQQTIRNIESAWKKHPVREINLYFLDIKITLTYTRYDYTFIPYLDQGWQLRVTPEYRTKITVDSNKKRSRRPR